VVGGFADTGGKACQLVKNFQWTNDAAKKWVDADPTEWKIWIPQ
jgi:hypothetical protein